MKYLKKLIFTSSLAVCFLSCAQSDKKSYHFDKGHVFDILLLQKKEGTDEQLKKYFAEVFPIAKEVGYNTLPGFSVVGSPTQGNYHPQAMILGYWNDENSRPNFLERIEEEQPNFHQTRRDIWSSFNLTYYELEEDLSFEVDPSKYNVVTAYWREDEKSFSQFTDTWTNESRQSGGREVLSLTNGKSPFGYFYRPDLLVITEWDSQESFESFYEKNLKMDHSAVKHVNQFVIQ